MPEDTTRVNVRAAAATGTNYGATTINNDSLSRAVLADASDDLDSHVIRIQRDDARLGTHEPVPPAKHPPKRSCRQRLITVFAWLFDFVTVSISLIDVVSDVLVALQFMRDGHSVWAWLVFGCFANSNVIYSAIIVQCVFKDKNNEMGYYQHVWRPLTYWPRPMLFVLVFPFAQLSPTLNYVFQTFFIKKRNGDAYDEQYRPRVVGIKVAEEAHTVAKEEHEAIKESVETMGRLQDALRKQFYTHGMLFAETVVEAIPQSIIQLLAITFLGSPSNLQVFSMALSLLSVVSKGYFLSVSCDLRVFAIKFLVVSHDVFSLFYVFCSIVSKDGPHEATIFGGLDVSYLTYIWFVKVMVVAATGVLALTLLGLTVLAGHFLGLPNAQLSWSDVKFGLVFTLGCIFGFIPALLALEGMQLIWLLLILTAHEPPTSSIPTAAMLFSFLQGKAQKSSSGAASTSSLSSKAPPVRASEWQRRLAYLHGAAYNHFLVHGFTPVNIYRYGPRYKVPLDDTARLQLHLEGSMREALLDARRHRAPAGVPGRFVLPWWKAATSSGTSDNVAVDDSWVDQCKSEEDIERDPVVCKEIMDALASRFYYTASLVDSTVVSRTELLQRHEKLVAAVEGERTRLAQLDLVPREQAEALSDFIVSEVYAPGRMRGQHLKQKPLIRIHVGGDPALGAILRKLFVIFHVVNGIGTVVSFVYPLINYPLHFATQNLLQHICFGLLVASLVLVVPLAPTLVDYVNFVFQHEDVVAFVGREKYSYEREYNTACVAELGKLIAAYHLPSSTHVLRDAVPPELVPTDVLGVVARFLPENALDLSKLSIQQCRALKRSIPT